MYATPNDVVATELKRRIEDGSKVLVNYSVGRTEPGTLI